MNEPDFVIEEWEADLSRHVRAAAAVRGAGRAGRAVQRAGARAQRRRSRRSAAPALRNLWAWEDPALGLDLLQVHSYPDLRASGARRRHLRHAGGGARRSDARCCSASFPATGPSRHPPRRVAAADDARASTSSSRVERRLRRRVAVELQRHRRLRPLPHEPLARVRARASRAGEPAVPRRDANRPCTLGHGLAARQGRQPHARRRHGVDRADAPLVRTRAAGSTSRGTRLLVAVSRFTPGTNVLAYCAALGWTVHRAAGAAVAIAGGVDSRRRRSSPRSAPWLRSWWPGRWCAQARGSDAGGGALVLSSAWALVRPHVFGSRRVWALAFAVAAAALFAGGITPIRVLLLSAVFGALSPPREGAS